MVPHSHPISVRLEVHRDGTGTLTTKATSGQGGDKKPGGLVMNKTRALTREQTKWALDRINEAGFWSLPSNEKNKNKIGLNGEEPLKLA